MRGKAIIFDVDVDGEESLGCHAKPRVLGYFRTGIGTWGYRIPSPHPYPAPATLILSDKRHSWSGSALPQLHCASHYCFPNLSQPRLQNMDRDLDMNYPSPILPWIALHAEKAENSLFHVSISLPLAREAEPTLKCNQDQNGEFWTESAESLHSYDFLQHQLSYAPSPPQTPVETPQNANSSKFESAAM